MPASDATTAYVVVALIVLVLVRRTFLMVQGARYSAPRIAAFSAFYLILYGALAGSTIAAAVGVWGDSALALVAAYAAVLVVATWVALPYVRRIVHFEERGPGVWYYRLPLLIPVLYLVLFVLRFAVEIVVFGPAVITNFVLPAVPGTTLLLVVGVDLLYSVSTGLLVARGVGVYQAHRALTARTPTPPAPPLPSPPLP